jgi:hypothetical protein
LTNTYPNFLIVVSYLFVSNSSHAISLPTKLHVPPPPSNGIVACRPVAKATTAR